MYGKIDGVTNFFEEDELMKRSKKILILLVVAIVLAGILEVIQVATSVVLQLLNSRQTSKPCQALFFCENYLLFYVVRCCMFSQYVI